MNIILDKKALNQWKDRIINLHQELNDKYSVIDCSFDIVNFTDEKDGFHHIIHRKWIVCSKCKIQHVLLFNYRYATINRNKYNNYIRTRNVCDKCLRIKIPIKY